LWGFILVSEVDGLKVRVMWVVIYWYTFVLLFALGVKVNLKVDRKAFPEVSLEVEVEVGCTLPIFLDSEGSVLRVKVM
jgi:hypothetical protein